MLAALRSWLWTDPLVLLLTAVFGTVSVAVSCFDPTGARQHRIARAWARALLRASGIRLTVEGAHHLAAGACYVFAANHRSLLDIPVLLCALPVPFRFLANDYLFRWPFIGPHLRRAGHLPVSPSSAREGVRTMTAAARAIADTGISIVLFPEGGRTHGEMKPFRDGAAYIAIKAGVPLAPVALLGLETVLPMDSSVIRGGAVTVRIGPPIPTSGASLRDRAALTAQVFDAVTTLGA